MAQPWEKDPIVSGAQPWEKDPVVGKQPAPDWSNVPGQALRNLPKSAGNFVGGIAQAVMHPIDTAGSLLDIGAGSLRNVLPAAWSDAIDKVDPSVNAAENQARMSNAADATGKFFADRYGSVDGLKTTLATDPVGAASDTAAVLSGGGTLAARLPMLARAGKAAQVAGSAVNPASLAIVAGKGVLALPKVGDAIRATPAAIGNGVAAAIGNLGTHTGAESIKQAFKSGKEGGASAQSLTDNMRGNVPMTDVLDAAKANLAAMGQQKSQAYRQGMAQVSGDKAVLGFGGIDQAVKDAGTIGTYKGQTTNAKAGEVHAQITDAIDQWKALDPAEFHTPEGLDALKKKVGGIVDSIPFEEKTAGLVGGNIYNAIKGEIVKQAPVYANTMKGYTEAADQIREIERALSLNKKASTDTAMRKLQSLTRNNAQTNYGNRLDMAQQLEQAGGQKLMPALAGQALSPMTPRGMGNIVAGPSGLAGWHFGGPVGAAGVLALQSPRMMGEAALAAGKGAAGVKKAATLSKKALGTVGMTPQELANYMYQVGRLPQQ